MATLSTERFRSPTTARELRALDSARKRAVDALAGRTVWSAVGMPDGRAGARRLAECLDWAGESGVAAEPLDVRAGEPLRSLARRLERRLRGRPAAGGEPAAAEGEVYAGAVDEGDGWMGPSVRADDVVVLHDPLATAMAEAVRERGAHAVWQIRISDTRGDAPIEDALSFLRRYTVAVDAFVVVRGAAGVRGIAIRQVAALLPSPGLVSARLAEGGVGTDDLAWTSVLADIVVDDRDERVGGTRHARPSIAAR